MRQRFQGAGDHVQSSVDCHEKRKLELVGMAALKVEG
jgi:hypothetical protein